MDYSMLVKVGVAFLSGFVAAASTAYLVDGNVSHALSTGAAAGIATAVAYLKRSPLAASATLPPDLRSPGN